MNAVDVNDGFGVGQFEVGPLTFQQWLDAIEAEVVRITSLQGGIGLGREDFNDWTYAAAFEDEVEPVQAARDILAEDVTGAQFLELAGIDGAF